MNGRTIAVCAVFTALLVSLQYVFSFVPGIELVTVVSACFCYVAGPVAGMVSLTCFSALRCLLFGFTPNVVILYLVYYNLFALLFGFSGKKSPPPWVNILLLSAIAVASAYFAAAGVPVSIVYKTRVCVMLWFVFALSAAVLGIYVFLLAKNKSAKGRELAAETTLAVICTIGFTLLDDLITPLVLGYTADAARAYFAASVYVMIVQSLCALITMLLLFNPVSEVFKRVLRLGEKKLLK